jgi:hypothetical protein
VSNRPRPELPDEEEEEDAPSLPPKLPPRKLPRPINRHPVQEPAMSSRSVSTNNDTVDREEVRPSSLPPRNLDSRKIKKEQSSARGVPRTNSDPIPKSTKKQNSEREASVSSTPKKPYVSKSEGGTIFTEDEEELLMENYDAIMDLDEDQMIDAWIAWASEVQIVERLDTEILTVFSIQIIQLKNGEITLTKISKTGTKMKQITIRLWPSLKYPK